ncbi:DNA polymerase III subunit delta' [Acetobacter oeni]|uniref:DNA polymerase III subunit delta n=1 Tax=Acetobacter oeni TaxID=304077 RepID=A0A511XKM5_9PROT|nr:DNA polymerase III subunit delta' [Acetobacter oeni]MBB3881317.1 DNA polymerase-3 subunit delta' [Acetobacter oeni]NHO18189.1 DNA polymerase III subunit delta' [Acetobacter oeni]GBR11370.1 DNA polymerase III subunit delta' [Acetobacter oeni LMG 21952]GEN63489.1 DNA polymerase III subunit delta' [Acetobacter oeni]
MAPRKGGARSATTEPETTAVTPLDTARRASLDVIGHDIEFATFRRAAASGRLHHAWLLTGPEGIGKAPLAFRMARSLLNAEDPTTPAARQITAGSHPDLLAIGRTFDEKRQKFRNEIVADEIRPINAFMHRTAAEGGWRVVIIDTAEAMNRNAANALLKVLEEPPARAILLLTCATPGMLLPTIRSRVRSLPVAPLSNAEIHAVLTRTAPETSPEELARVVPLAQGSPGRAMTLLADTGGTIDAIAHEAIKGMTTARMLNVADAIGRSDTGFDLFFTLLGSAMVQTTRGIPPPDLSRSVKLAEAWEKVMTIRKQTEQFNLDKQEAMIEAMSVAGTAHA